MQTTVSPTGRLPSESLADRFTALPRISGSNPLSASLAELKQQRRAENAAVLADTDYSSLERRVLAHMGHAAAALK